MKKSLLLISSAFVKMILAVFFSAITLNSFSQTGVFYFSDKLASANNNKIVDIVEISNAELCLLGKLTDKDYQNPEPFFLHLNKSGVKIKQTTLNSKSLYEVNRLVLLPNDQLKVLGSQIVDGKYSPFTQIIDKNGVEKSSDYSFTVYSTLVGDVMEYDDEEIIMIDTKLGKSEKYSITAQRLNTTSNNKIWSKSIISSSNEEANQVYVTRDKSILVLGKRYNEELSEYSPILYKYTSDGEQLWFEEIDVPKNFFNQSVCTDKKGNIYYICGYTKETTGKSETKIIKLSPDKIKIKTISLENFSANGIIAMSSGDFLIYGSNLKVHQGRVITKGKTVVMDNELTIEKEDELSIQDKPDSELPVEAMKKFPTSSDLLTGIQLRDGRIALAGRVFMPVDKGAADNINAARHNCALLVITDKSGNFR